MSPRTDALRTVALYYVAPTLALSLAYALGILRF